ncbi:energy-coupling factor transporter transmembrane component T [Vagococcus fessus]|uniref:Cobalt ABC transporter permease n=1 Tax=Vagococcus fessus TaxID=120370 RepID=A0A430AC69_9ENTE|nr:energy-coupling factor transporter transmembrane component T [Vagococcus fessus]RSU04815.1 hypothetical protein CBF31_02005 [Vagococcus fessus]
MINHYQEDESVLGFYHPVLLLSFYCLVLLITMFTDDPIVRTLSFLGGLSSCYITVDRDTFFKNLKLGSFLVFISALSNFLFIHSGATILYILKFKLFGKNFRYLFTFESFVYGFLFGIMMFAMLMWFQSLNKVLTTDKVNYLFGRSFPKIALILSMVMRFLPMYQRQLRTIQQAQEGLGQIQGERRIEKAKSGTTIFGSLFSWALENAIETSDSMNARGFGLKSRTNFSIFKWRSRDILFSIVIIFLSSCILYFFTQESFKFNYYSKLHYVRKDNLKSILGYCVVILTFSIPVLVEVKEWLKWRYLVSKI